MLEWSKYRSQIFKRVPELARLSPDTVRGHDLLAGAAAKTSHLDPKTRELISLACAVTTRCDGCITVHTHAAIEQGATKDEIAEALSVAIAMNAGAALVYSTCVLDAFEAHANAKAVAGA